MTLDTAISVCYAALDRLFRQRGDSMSSIVVTEIASVNGHDVPVEALVFNRHAVIYSRLIVPPDAVPVLLDAGFKPSELHIAAVLN